MLVNHVFLFWNQTNHDVYYLFVGHVPERKIPLPCFFRITLGSPKVFVERFKLSQSWWAEKCIQIQVSRTRLTPRWMKNPLSGCWIWGVGCLPILGSLNTLVGPPNDITRLKGQFVLCFVFFFLRVDFTPKKTSTCSAAGSVELSPNSHKISLLLEGANVYWTSLVWKKYYLRMPTFHCHLI